MTDTQQDRDEGALEALFAQARATPPEVPPALVARVLADAQAAQPVRPGRWRLGRWRFWQVLGGAPGLGGLAMVTAVGFWIGVAPHALLPDSAGELLSLQSAETAEDVVLVDGFGWDLDEG